MNRVISSPRRRRTSRHLSTWKLAPALVAALHVVALAVASCGGGSKDPGATGGAGGAPPAFGASACWACVEGACSKEITACAAEPECAGYIDCLGACPTGDPDVDAACADGCKASAAGAGIDAMNDLIKCREAGEGAAKCPQCGRTPPEPMGPALFDQQCPAYEDPDACTVCKHDHCCDSYAACEASAECQAMEACVLGCGGLTPECLTNCAIQNPDGVSKYTGRIACGVFHCIHVEETCHTDNPCVTGCWFGACEDKFLACWLDAACFALQWCVEPCVVNGDTPDVCIDQCNKKFPSTTAADEAYSAYINCSAGCLTSCGAL